MDTAPAVEAPFGPSPDRPPPPSPHPSPPPTATKDPWERLPEETGPAWRAFQAYRDTPPGQRGLKGVLLDLGKPASYRRQLERWRSAHRWPSRADAYDVHIDGLAREELEPAMLRARRAYQELGNRARRLFAGELGELEQAQKRRADAPRIRAELRVADRQIDVLMAEISGASPSERAGLKAELAAARDDRSARARELAEISRPLFRAPDLLKLATLAARLELEAGREPGAPTTGALEEFLRDVASKRAGSGAVTD